jgi:Lar family restriction alleviation protein
MTELKPCPFCGDLKDLQILNQGDLVDFDCHYNCEKQKGKIGELAHTWFVSCPTCGACGPDFFFPSQFNIPPITTDEECKARAIEAWNRRTEEAEVDNG